MGKFCFTNNPNQKKKKKSKGARVSDVFLPRIQIFFFFLGGGGGGG